VEIGQLAKVRRFSGSDGFARCGGEIILLNVTENLPGYLSIELPLDFIERNVADATERLKALNETCGANAKVLVRVGSPGRDILAAAEQLSADLVIIASHQPDMSNYLLGSTADRVVRHAIAPSWSTAEQDMPTGMA